MHEVEKKLVDYGKTLPVNARLRQELRQQFAQSTRTGRKGWPYVLAIAATLAMIIGGVYNGLRAEPVLAAKLQVEAQYSFIDMTSGQHGAPAVNGESIYLPLYGKGIYLLDTTGVRSGEGLVPVVLEPGVVSVTLSQDGSKLCYATSKGLFVYDLAEKKGSPLALGNEHDVYYEEPAWVPGGASIIAKRRTVEWKEHGFTVRAEELVEVLLADGEVRKITDGTSPSVSPDGASLFFERDGAIYVRALKATSVFPWQGLRLGQEKMLGKGSSPSVSPDGRLVAYLKDEEVTRKLSPQATVVENVTNVYVANSKDFTDHRKITANYPHHFVDEKTWAQSVAGEETLQFNGVYSYYSPVWGSDSGHVFALKSSTEGTGMRLMRIDLSEMKETKTTNASGALMRELVSRYLEAVVNRDADTIRLLYHGEVLPLTSNPRVIGFDITAAGAESSEEYVDAVVCVAYTGQPYYEHRALRFWCNRGAHGYTIGEVVERERLELTGKGRNVYLNDEMVTALREPLGPLVYDQRANRLYYTIEGREVRVYDPGDKSDKLLISLTSPQTVIESVSVNHLGSEAFLAINLTSAEGPRGMLYSINNSMPVQTLGRANRIHWAGHKLLCYTLNNDELIRWEYHPLTGESTIFPK